MFLNNINKKTDYVQSSIYASDAYPKHPYHLVDPSPHPYVASLGVLGLTFGSVLYFHSYIGGKFLMFFVVCVPSAVTLKGKTPKIWGKSSFFMFVFPKMLSKIFLEMEKNKIRRLSC